MRAARQMHVCDVGHDLDQTCAKRRPHRTRAPPAVAASPLLPQGVAVA